MTKPPMDKFPLYARLGVPEVWRYDGEKLRIFHLEGEAYKVSPESGILPGFTDKVISELVEEGKSMKRSEWMKKVRETARGKTR